MSRGEDRLDPRGSLAPLAGAAGGYPREQLRHLSYGQAKDFYRHGAVGQADWDWYRHVWRNSQARVSSVDIELEHRSAKERAECPTCQAAGLVARPRAGAGEAAHG